MLKKFPWLLAHYSLYFAITISFSENTDRSCCMCVQFMFFYIGKVHYNRLHCKLSQQQYEYLLIKKPKLSRL